ncbi:subtilisin [Cordyceps javanica]|uniref:Subtilisin n=1 Tax=Cordyceps javanica TaxID=43265 RepID=A0A545VD50_9HYPO|nr:subtilisin [Cordyceps javanica]TQW10684.1 subtilisin [Cordyceps javanica]
MGHHLDHVRVHFDFEHFKGASIQVNDSQVATNATYALYRSRSPAAKNVWPVYVYDRPILDATEVTPSGLNARDDTYSPHVMMQVDQLRAQGFDGKGVKLAVIDSGVDYKHPALGGCFGPGCRVSFGYDLVGDDYNGGNKPQPDSDPMDCGSHGTHVSGIVTAEPNAAGFTGVAPGVTFGMYRVFGCSGGTGTDVLMAAAARAAEDGAQIISCSVGGAYGWSDDGFSHLLSKLAREKGITPVVAAGNDGSRGALYSSGSANSAAVNSIASADLPEKNGTGGTPSAFSSWGPTMEMDLKPQFTGPGGDILSTLPDNKYGKASGTSMSTPMVAGVIALLNQAMGPVTPERMHQLLTVSAKPLNFSDGSKTYGVLAPAAQQGAGLVQALNALHTKTLVSPTSLSFNDTEHMNSNMEVSVKNSGNQTVEYQLLVRPAVTVYILANGSPAPSAFPNDQTPGSGSLNATVIKFTLTAGQTQILHVSASPPAAVDTKRLALWSGFLSIHGNDSSVASIPYQGLAGALRNATTLPPDGTSVARSNDEKRTPVSANTEFMLPKPGTSSSDDVVPLISANLTLGTTTLTAQIVDAGTGTVLADMADVPYRKITRNSGFGIYWYGKLSNGTYAGEGTYKVRIKALRIYGDAANGNDWDTSDSVPIKICYKKTITARPDCIDLMAPTPDRDGTSPIAHVSGAPKLIRLAAGEHIFEKHGISTVMDSLAPFTTHHVQLCKQLTQLESLLQH